MDDQKFLLPWYINQSLSADERPPVESWLQNDPDADALLNTTRQIAATVRSLDVKEPVHRVESDLLARIRREERKKAKILQWAWSVPLVTIIFAILWIFVQPGTQLQWSVSGSDLAAFRVYRAPTNSTTFELLEEVPAASEKTSYQFTDGTVLLPGKTYHYVIEIVAQNGNTAVSPAVASNTLMTLSSQFAILLTSFMLTFGMITVIQEIKSLPQSNLIR